MLSSLITAITAANMPASPAPSTLADALARVPDPRDPRGVRYPLAEVLSVLLCARSSPARAPSR